MAVHFPGVLTFQSADEDHKDQLPIVLDSPHSGMDYPADFDTVVPEEILRGMEDSFVDELYADVVNKGGSFLKAHYPRSYIDPNRSDDDIDISMIEGNWPFQVQPTEKTVMGHGLIWKSCPGHPQMYARNLSILEVKHRIDKYWKPYHTYLENEIERLYSLFGSVWHVNCHSMPASSSPYMPGAIGNARADVVLGDRNGSSCDQEFTYLLRDWFVEKGYKVRINNPYKGAELVRRYGRPEHDRHSIQIELNRALYMNERRVEPTRHFSHLKADLNEMIDVIGKYVAHKCSYRSAAE
ncbi:N-formylglutamate amidohydrolase [Curvivirga sp.]|uniref:N-formylglutamate amidohydrolase n=1 Tax=Curvivirga sp. TaxID=2856848 RepID=UPI003B5B30BE